MRTLHTEHHPPGRERALLWRAKSGSPRRGGAPLALLRCWQLRLYPYFLCRRDFDVCQKA